MADLTRSWAALVLASLFVLAGCSDAEPDAADMAVGPDASALSGSLVGVLDDRITAQVDAGLPEGPLGRPLDDCPILDRPGLDALGAILDVGSGEVEVLSAAITTPSTTPGVTCALLFSDASAGAVVVGMLPTDRGPDEVISDLIAADYEDAGDASAAGLADSNVFLLNSTRFEASRAVWTDTGIAVSVTGNADVVAQGQLLALLSAVVVEVVRVLG